jgi:hypothetical protein
LRVYSGKQLGGYEPADLELQPIRVLGVERLGGAVVGLVDQRSGVDQSVLDVLEFKQRLDFPGQVIEPDRGCGGRRG